VKTYVEDPAVIKLCADKLLQYFDGAREEAIKGRLDALARSNMGIIAQYLDPVKDTIASLRKETGEPFGVKLKADLKASALAFTSNKSDLGTMFVNLAEPALKHAANAIPVPGLGSVVGTLIGFGADAARDELHTRSIAEADATIGESIKGQAELRRLFTTDKAALEVMQKSMVQYKTIGKLIESMPSGAPKTFDETIAMPTTTFRIEEAISALNVTIWTIRDYLQSMSERLNRSKEVIARYRTQLRTETPGYVRAIVNASYNEANSKALVHLAQRRYLALERQPEPDRAPWAKPASELLADLMGYAMASGYWDAGYNGGGSTRVGADASKNRWTFM